MARGAWRVERGRFLFVVISITAIGLHLSDTRFYFLITGLILVANACLLALSIWYYEYKDYFHALSEQSNASNRERQTTDDDEGAKSK